MALRRPLQLNFFSVALGDSDLPFLVRPLPTDQVLDARERLWEREVAADHERKAAYVSEELPASGRYAEEQHKPADASPGIVKLLLEAGLRAHFVKAGHFLEPARLGFFCSPDAASPSDVPSFLVFRRGLDFRVDHLTVRGQRIFGFFVSLRTRLRFLAGLEDPKLSDAALRQDVSLLTDAGRQPVMLLARKGEIATVLDEVGAQKEVPVTAIRVPASPHLLSRYCELIGRPELRHQIWLLGQTRTYRLLPSGQRNRKWLRDQMDQISRDLLMGSQFGKVPFMWPHSSISLSLEVTPSEAVERLS